MAAGATLNLMPNVRAEIAFNTQLTINGTANLQSGSTLNFGSSTGSIQMVVNGQLNSVGATIVGASRSLDINGTAIANFENTTVNNTLVNLASSANVTVLANDGVPRVFGSGGLTRVLSGIDSLAVQYGSTLAIPQSLEVGASSVEAPSFSISYSSTLSLTGSLTGRTQSAANFQANGRVVFNGTGTTAAPQRLEVMGADLGATPQGSPLATLPSAELN